MANLYKFQSAYTLAESLYGVDTSTDTEEIALNGWLLIGNKHTRFYRYIGDTDDEGVLELPCNAEIIESVTIPKVDAQSTTSDTNFANIENIYVENYVESRKHAKTEFYVTGKLVDYKEGDGVLYLPRPLKNVCVLYQGVLVNEEDGLPLINDKEQMAIACYLAYATSLKDGLRKKNKDSLTLAQTMEGQWLRRCNAARIPEHLSQNDMNKILDVKTRWDRKTYGHSLKPIL